MSDVVNFINLPTRYDRLISVESELKKQGIEGRRWDGIIDKEQSLHNNKRGIAEAHKRIVRWAKENKLPYVRIAEDDLRFFPGYAWEYYLLNEPKSFDIYLGMIYIGKFDSIGKLTSAISGFTLYTVHQKFYDKFLEADDTGHIDRDVTAMYEKYEMYVCPKFVCEQIMSKSDNNGCKVNLRRYLEGREIFGNPKLYELPL